MNMKMDLRDLSKRELEELQAAIDAALEEKKKLRADEGGNYCLVQLHPQK